MIVIENQKAMDNAMFKKLQQIAIKMPSDPILYKQDVEKYKNLFSIQFEKVQGDTMKKNQRFGQLLIFLAKAVRFFPKDLGFIPSSTMSLMNELGKSLNPYNRRKCVSAIMILRAKNILYPISTIEFLIKQFNIEDKQLRQILYKYILNDIRRMNRHHKNNQINQELKKFISQYITKFSDKTAQKSLQLMIDLYKRNIWTDNRTVNIIAEGCFNASPKIRLIACHFLVSTTEPLEELSDSDDEPCVNPSDIKWKKGIRKHTKNKQKQLEKEKKRASRRLRKKEIAGRKENFMPIDLIYSPQDFAEKLFNLMNQKQTKFSHKLFYMALISRIIWRHKLIMLPFYGALQKYMDPRQKQAAKVLTYFAESVHQLVPDDEIEPIVKHIIQTFVNDKCSQFAMTIGLNTIRQIYSKACSLITEDAMTYLCTYYEYKNKNVCMAAKSVINLVRQLNPYLLQKKYRGKNHNEPINPLKQSVGVRIKGAQLLGEDQDNEMPVEMSRILTEQDFKKIRKLIKKQEEQDGWGDMVDENAEELEMGNDDMIQGGDQGEEQDVDSQLTSEADLDQGQSEIQWGDAEQVEEQGLEVQSDVEGIDDEQQVQEDSSLLQIDSEEEQQIDLQGENQEQSKRQVVSKTKKIVKAKKNNQQLESSDEEQESEEDNNPHGFLDVGQIAFYKKSKTQIKLERKRNPQLKVKFKHKPKEKKGGKTNEQKLKNKPLMMLRDKKNKIKSHEKQVKLKIKNLKNQLGKVRSNKQAKKKNNRKLKRSA